MEILKIKLKNKLFSEYYNRSIENIIDKSDCEESAEYQFDYNVKSEKINGNIEMSLHFAVAIYEEAIDISVDDTPITGIKLKYDINLMSVDVFLDGETLEVDDSELDDIYFQCYSE